VSSARVAAIPVLAEALNPLNMDENSEAVKSMNLLKFISKVLASFYW